MAQIDKWGDRMNNLMRLGLVAALAIIWIGSVSTPSRADSITGTFQGFANMEVKTYEGAHLVSDNTYTSLASTINFTLYYNDPAYQSGSYFIFSISNSVFSLDTSGLAGRGPYEAGGYAIDGIPGQSADYAFATAQGFSYHTYNLASTFQLVDPSGEFIGPNGDGDPSNVQITTNYSYNNLDTSATGQAVTTSFLTLSAIPEPSSVVLATIAALVMSAVGLSPVCRNQSHLTQA
jgi:hypothetical protein